MSGKRKKLIISLQICSLIIMAVFFSPTLAFSGDISLDYKLGFSGRFRLGTFVPVSVILENRGRPVSGVVEVKATSGSEYRRDVMSTLYRADAELPTDSTKLFSLTVRINSFTHPLIISFKSHGRVLAVKSINLRPVYEEKPLVLALGSNAAADFLTWLPSSVKLVTADAHFLPETYFGYQGVELVIIHPSVWRDLREKQFDALASWVTAGGFLVTAGSHNYGAFLTERVAGFLDIKIKGFSKLKELTSLRLFSGEPLVAEEPFLVVVSEIGGASALAREGSIPIILQKEIGLGRILFLAFDYQEHTFARWPGRFDFWEKLLTLKPRIQKSGLALDGFRVSRTLVSNPGAGFPKAWMLLVVLILYLVAIFILFRLLERRPEKRKLNFALLFSTVIIFSAVCFGLIYFPALAKNPAYNSFIHLKKIGSRSTVSASYHATVSSLKKQELAVDIERAALPVMAAGYFANENPGSVDIIVTKKIKGQRVSIPLARWAERTIRLETIGNLNIRGRAFWDGDELVLEVENNTGSDLYECRVLFMGRLFSFGSIKKGPTTVKRLPMKVIVAEPLFNPSHVSHLLDQRAKDRSALLESLIQRHTLDLLTNLTDVFGVRSDALKILAWSETEMLPIGAPDGFSVSHSVTLLEWEIPVSGEMPDEI